MKQRWILHADMDAFYASVEQRDNPALSGQPVIVGGLMERGVVAAASYEARKYGVHSAMPISKARRLCPDGVYIRPNMNKYRQVSAEIVTLLERFSPCLETLALDEAFLDISGMELLYDDVRMIGQAIKEAVWQELQLVISVGIAPNKFLAKLASAFGKPNGLVVIRPGEEERFLEPLPIDRLWGVGTVTERALRALQINTIGQLRRADIAQVERRLGNQARELYQLAWGRDTRPVVPEREAKSIGHEDTFAQDIFATEDILRELLALAERVGWRLRRAGLAGRTITLKVRFASFHTVTRAVTLADPTALDAVLYQTVRQLLAKIPCNEGIRLLGITVSHLGAPGVQLNLFNEHEAKQERIAQAMDRLTERFGNGIVKRSRLL